MPRFCLVIVTIALLAAEPNGAQAAKATQVKVRAMSCAKHSTLFSREGVCYIYDISEEQASLEISMAAGLRISGSTLIVGLDAETVLEVKLSFPMGTSKAEAIAEAKKELNKALAKQSVKDKIAQVEGRTYAQFTAPRCVENCSGDAKKTAQIKKALGK